VQDGQATFLAIGVGHVADAAVAAVLVQLGVAAVLAEGGLGGNATGGGAEEFQGALGAGPLHVVGVDGLT